MTKKVFLAIGLNPTLQKTLVFSNLVNNRVNRTAEHRFDAAGKGVNTGRVLKQLGKDCVHLTQLGGALRPVFLERCAEDGLDIRWVESQSPIRFCYTLVNRETGEVTELVEEGEKVGEGTGERLLEALDSLLPELGCVIISGSRAAGFGDGLVPEMVRRAKRAGLFVILDLRGDDLVNSLPFGPDLIKPNLDEFTATFAPETPAGEDPGREKTAALCGELWTRYGCRVVLTRGAKSIWYAESGGLEDFPLEAVPPLNTTGSGDAFTAGLAAAILDGASFKEALAEGARCGRLNALLLRPGAIF